MTSLQDVNSSTSATVTQLSTTSDALNTAIQTASQQASGLSQTLTGTVTALTPQVAAISGSASGLAASLDSQRTVVTQAKDLLTALDTQLVSTSDALSGLATTLDGIDASVQTVRTDIAAIGSAAGWSEVTTLTDLDPAQIADFMASPVQVNQQVLFPTTYYGSGMAALFTNLSLWIGSFVLMVILKLEVDNEGVESLTVRQAYLGRWLLLACIAIPQALLVTAGDLVLGVQTVNAAAFIGTGVLTALAYLSIIYALSVSFAHIGKGLCVVLVIMQIPGASGLYPIEMMPSFFQSLYPFFPFTYGINAMRETISGFYDGHYVHELGTLALFVAVAFVLGLFIRGRLGTLTRLFSRQIATTDLLVTEEVHSTDSYRLSQVLRSLANRDDYRRYLESRARSFARHYPRLRRGSLIVGLVVPIVLLVWPPSGPDAKALILGLWVGFFLLMSVFLIVLEYVRDAITDGLELAAMPDSDLRTVMAGHRPTPQHARHEEDA